MVIAGFTETMQTIGTIATFLVPILLLTLGILYKKGVITKGQKETAEGVIKILTGSIDQFKSVDKTASKGVTSIIGKKVENTKIKDDLEGYLKKFEMNGNGESN
jgi:hypothetical protein